MKIKILKKPYGDAPEWVKEAWVGKILPVSGGPDTINGMEVVSGKSATVYGFSVNIILAVKTLNEKAEKWWREKCAYLFYPPTNLIFDADCCELINE